MTANGDFELGPWRVQPHLNAISSGADSRRLEPKVMQVLVRLASQPGQVVSKEDLIADVWSGAFVSDDSILRCISELRRILDDDPKDPRFIQTIAKRGYRLIAEIRPVQTPPTASARLPRALLAALLALALLCPVAYLAWRRLSPSPQPPAAKLMLVVLPLQNLSGDPNQEYFSDGLTEELISQLAELHPQRLGVIALTTAMHYKGKGKDIGQIGRELGVNYVLEGAVRRENDRVRITAQLIEVAGQAHLWAHTYDQRLSSILALQKDVAQTVAGRVRLALVSGPAAPADPTSAVNPEAYEAFLSAALYRKPFNPHNLDVAIERLRRAVEVDPAFAQAWASLAVAYGMQGTFFGDRDPKQMFTLASQAADRALQLDSSLGDAYIARGWIRFTHEWNWADAEADFKRSIELSSRPGPHHAYAAFLRAMNRFPEARAEFERCLEIDPLSPFAIADAALNYLDLQQTAEADKLIARLKAITDSHHPPAYDLAVFHLRKGEPEKALRITEELIGQPRPARRTVTLYASACVATGNSANARECLQKLLKIRPRSPFAISKLHSFLGDSDNALLWMETAFAERDASMIGLRSSSKSHPLRRDPRFLDLLRRMSFPS